MASKPKYKYFIYKARKRFGKKLINITVTGNNDVYLTLREEKEKPIRTVVFENVFKWEITTYAPIGYKTERYFINNIDLNHTKFDTLFKYIENDFNKK